jgi:hypothetical protein
LDVGALGTDIEFLRVIERWLGRVKFPLDVMTGGLAFAEGGLSSEGDAENLDNYDISTLFR